MPKAPAAKRRNLLAKVLRDPRYRQRKAKAGKGRGTYRRHPRQELAPGKRGEMEE